MTRGKKDQDPRMLGIYESIATAVYNHHTRQSLTDNQMDFLLSFLEGVYYHRLNDDFINIIRECVDAGIMQDADFGFRDFITRTDISDEDSVKAHYRILRHWLDEKAR